MSDVAELNRLEQPIPPPSHAADTEYRELGGDGLGPEKRQPLAGESAIAISYNGINHAVMMATPTQLEDFALGFSLTSGTVADLSQIVDISVQPHVHGQSSRIEDSVLLDITLNQRALHGFKSMRRSLMGTSGCGLCGVDALVQALPEPASLHNGPLAWRPLPRAAHLANLRARFDSAQESLRHSGAMHGAIYVDAAGETRFCREDIGRHNALDKLIGACLRAGSNPAQGYFATTSRCSVELVQKVARAGGGTLVTLSSPSQLCVQWARQCRLNLIHQPKQSPARVFSPGPGQPTDSAGSE